MDLNVLIRGQSNALLFADWGGAWALEQGLEARLGVDVHLLMEWNTDSSTIHSGTAFMSWDTDGQQASLMKYVNELPADLKDNLTATVWIHNEYDQGDWSITKDSWLAEVRADAAMVRAALGQDADTTPYTFVPVRYLDRADVAAAQATQGGVAGLLVTYGGEGTVFLQGVNAPADRDMAFG